MKHNYPSNYVKPRFCGQCGTQNSTNNKYCVNCGFELAKESLDTIDYQLRNQNVPPAAKSVEKEVIILPPSNSSKGIVAIILFIAIAVLFIATNPNEKAHLDFIQKERFSNKLKSSTEDGAFFLKLGKLIIPEDNFNSILKSEVARTNYLFFSITRNNKDSEILTIGILGNVFLWEDWLEKIDSIAL